MNGADSASTCRTGAAANPVTRAAPSGRHLAGDQRDPVGFQALLAFDDIDPDPLPRLDDIQLAAPQRRNMNENVLAATVGRNEGVTLLEPEPLHLAFERLRRAHGPLIDPSRARRDSGAHVDAEDIGHEGSLCPGGDLAGDGGALAALVI